MSLREQTAGLGRRFRISAGFSATASSNRQGPHPAISAALNGRSIKVETRPARESIALPDVKMSDEPVSRKWPRRLSVSTIRFSASVISGKR
jgi:hypothetical protein